MFPSRRTKYLIEVEAWSRDSKLIFLRWSYPWTRLAFLLQLFQAIYGMGTSKSENRNLATIELGLRRQRLILNPQRCECKDFPQKSVAATPSVLASTHCTRRFSSLIPVRLSSSTRERIPS